MKISFPKLQRLVARGLDEVTICVYEHNLIVRTRASIAQIETGSSNPSLEILLKLSVTLKVSIDELISPPVAEVELIRSEDIPLDRKSKDGVQIRKLLPHPIPSTAIDEMNLEPNIPTNEFHELGKTANLIWKYAFQKACLARKSKHDFMRPVFLWADEAQEFIHPDDVKFQATARSTRCSTVYLTQNIAGLRFGLGSGIKASDAIKSMEANLLTTIFHQNIDLETNEYAAKTIGTKKEKVVSTSSKGTFSEEVTKNVSYRDAPIFKQEDFLNLKSGGPTNKKLVESIVFVPGGKLFLNPLELGLKDWHKIIVTQGKYDYFFVNF
jgi:transcriptional regulator with XRE-family HTH domain